MTLVSYTQKIAIALGASPTTEDCLRLWDAVSGDGAPSVGDVVGEALQVGNIPALEACLTRLNGAALHPDEQAEALMKWRRTATTDRLFPAEMEYDIGRFLARTGLIGPQALMKESQGVTGPIAWMLKHFRRDGARGILDAKIEADADDLAQALDYSVEKVSAARSDENIWNDMVRALLEAGADPDRTVRKMRSFSGNESTSRRITDSGDVWSKREIGLVKSLLGKRLDNWNERDNDTHTHTAFSRWLSTGGDPQMGLRFAKGKPITLEALGRVISTFLENKDLTEPQITAFMDPLFQHNLGLPRVELKDFVDCAVQMTMLGMRALMKTGKNNALKIDKNKNVALCLYDVGEYMVRLLPADDRNDGLAAWGRITTVACDEAVALLEKRGNAEQAIVRLQNERDATQLFLDTEASQGQRRNPRL